MNILFIGQFRINGDGWTEASKSIARSFATQDCNLVLRNINMANQPPNPLDNDLIPFYNKKLSHYDVVIQKVLPNLLTYDARFKQNIAIEVFETEFPKTHPWINRFKLMDKLFVGSLEEKRWVSNYHNKVYNIGEAIDTTITEKKYQPIHPIFEQNLFKFYCINSASERKNLNTLITAYFRAFTSNDNVVLILKTANINEEINRIKNSLRLHFNANRYPPIVLINNHLTDDQLNSIHAYCDCFVTPSKGESFSRTAATALIFGNPVISTDKIGITDYLYEDMGWLVPSIKTYVNCYNPPMAEIYRGNEQWYEIKESALIDAMQEAYLDKELFKYKKQVIKNSSIKDALSYKTIGKKLMSYINE